MCSKEVKLLRESGCIAIAPYFNGKHSSVIETHQGNYYSEESVERLIQHYCLSYGSTLEGRLKASRERLGYIKNPPILISEREGIVAMQLPCYDTIGTIWITDLNFEIEEMGTHCEIVFKGNIRFKVNLSKNAIIQRKLKALDLLYCFVM